MRILFESLKKYSDEDNKQDSILNIINIVKGFLSITGIKLNDNDELVVTESSNLCKTNIKNIITIFINIHVFIINVHFTLI